MRIKPTLMMMATTLAPLPLCAQEAATPAATAPAQQAPSAAATRAKALAPLALIPADVEAAIIVNHFGSILQALENKERPVPVESIAIGLSKGSGASLQSFIRMVYTGFAEDIQEKLVNEIFANTREELAEAIENGLPSEPDKDAFQTAAANIKIKPVYVVLTATPGMEDRFNAELDSMVKGLRRAAERKEFVSIEEQGGNVHVTISGKNTYHAGRDWQSHILKEEIDKRTLHMNISRSGNQAVITYSEEPDQALTAPTSEQSVLDTKAWAAVDANLDQDIVVAMSVSPDLLNARTAIVSELAPTIAPFCVIFSNLAKTAEGTDDAKVYTDAAECLKQTLAWMEKAIPDVKEPNFIQVWTSADGVHAEATCDAMGVSYKPAQLKHTAKADDPQTIYYAEATPVDIAGEAQQLDFTPVINAIAATLPKQDQETVKAEMEAAKPLTDAMGSILCNLCEGLGAGTSSIVIDNRATAPAWVMDKADVIIPRIAFHSGVSDRAKLSQAWDGLMSTARTVMEGMGEDASVLDMLPIVPTTVGDATSYTVALPIFTPDMCPNVTVSDTAFAIGSSSKLNQELTAATGTQEFAGAVFSLRLAPLADMLSTWCSGGCQGDCEVDQAAEALKAAASVIETIGGTSTIKGGVHTLHIDVKFKK